MAFSTGVAVDRIAPRVAVLIPVVLTVVLGWWRQRVAAYSQALAAGWEQGAEGEELTRRLLRRVERRGYVAFHDLAIPRSAANVDHLVIGPTGVFVVDSKLYESQIVWEDPWGWSNKGKSLAPRLKATRFEARRVDEILNDVLDEAGVDVEALWCVHGEGVLHRHRVTADDITIVTASWLLRELRRRPKVLSPEQVAVIAKTAEERFLPAS